jgi:hypothetical protein
MLCSSLAWSSYTESRSLQFGSILCVFHKVERPPGLLFQVRDPFRLCQVHDTRLELTWKYNWNGFNMCAPMQSSHAKILLLQPVSQSADAAQHIPQPSHLLRVCGSNYQDTPQPYRRLKIIRNTGFFAKPVSPLLAGLPMQNTFLCSTEKHTSRASVKASPHTVSPGEKCCPRARRRNTCPRSIETSRSCSMASRPLFHVCTQANKYRDTKCTALLFSSCAAI